MAHFAEIDESNIVLRVIVVSDADTQNDQGVEAEEIGAAFCARTFGGRWIKTSYNGRIRKNFAGIGYFYDEARDAFIPPRPGEDAVFDEETCRWILPPSPGHVP